MLFQTFVKDVPIHCKNSRKKSPKPIELKRTISDLLENIVDNKYYYNESSVIYKKLKDSITKKGVVYQWRRKYVRENKIPFLGICLGLQLACIEFARNILQLENANSLEFSKNAPYEIITIMSSQKEVTNKGGTMRLGAYDCRIQPGTKAFAALSESAGRHQRCAAIPAGADFSFVVDG